MRKILKEWRLFLEDISKSEISYFGKEFEELMANPDLALNKDWISRTWGRDLVEGTLVSLMN